MEKLLNENNYEALFSKKVTVSSLFTLISLSNTAYHVTHGKPINQELRLEAGAFFKLLDKKTK